MHDQIDLEFRHESLTTFFVFVLWFFVRRTYTPKPRVRCATLRFIVLGFVMLVGFDVKGTTDPSCLSAQR